MDDSPKDYGAPVYLKKSQNNKCVPEDAVFVNIDEGDLPDYHDFTTFRPKAGDLIVWHARTIHKIDGPTSQDWGSMKRRVLGGTVAIDDATYVDKEKVEFADMGRHSLKHGDPLTDPHFPKIWPRPDPAEVVARFNGDVGRSREGFGRMVGAMFSAKTFEQFASWGNVLKKKDQAVEEEEVEQRRPGGGGRRRDRCPFPSSAASRSSAFPAPGVASAASMRLRRRKGGARAPRPSSGGLLRHRRIKHCLRAGCRMMKRKSDPPKKARAGLIKSFELKRRKQSENSNRVRAKSPGDGTAVAAGAPANTAELPPACGVGAEWPEARVRGLCKRESGSSPCVNGSFKHESCPRCAIAARAGPKPQTSHPAATPRDPPTAGRQSHADSSEFGVRLRFRLQQ